MQGEVMHTYPSFDRIIPLVARFVHSFRASSVGWCSNPPDRIKMSYTLWWVRKWRWLKEWCRYLLWLVKMRTPLIFSSLKRSSNILPSSVDSLLCCMHCLNSNKSGNDNPRWKCFRVKGVSLWPNFRTCAPLHYLVKESFNEGKSLAERYRSVGQGLLLNQLQGITQVSSMSM